MLMAIEAASPSRISAVDHQKQEQILSTSSCELDAAGFYGEPTGQAYEIEFVYQVTTTPEATPEIVDEDVTPALDVAVIAELLPFLFPSACQSSKGMERRTKGLRQLQQQGVFNGISMREQDELIAYADVPCPGDNNGPADANCFIIQGKSIVFAEGYSSEEEVKAKFQTALQQAMGKDGTNPNLVSPHPMIVRVRVVDEDVAVPAMPKTPATTPPTAILGVSQEIPSSPEENHENDDGAKSKNIPWWVWLIVGLVGAMLLLLCFVAGLLLGRLNNAYNKDVEDDATNTEEDAVPLETTGAGAEARGSSDDHDLHSPYITAHKNLHDIEENEPYHRGWSGDDEDDEEEVSYEEYEEDDDEDDEDEEYEYQHGGIENIDYSGEEARSFRRR